MASSSDDVLFEAWNIMRPRPVPPGFATSPPMSLLDFALHDGPLELMSLQTLMGPPPMVWTGMVPAAPPRHVQAPCTQPALEVPRVVKLPASSSRLAPSAEDASDRSKALQELVHNRGTHGRGLHQPGRTESAYARCNSGVFRCKSDRYAGH